MLGIFGSVFKTKPESECLTHYPFDRFVLSRIFARYISQIEIDSIYRFLCIYRNKTHSSLKYELSVNSFYVNLFSSGK